MAGANCSVHSCVPEQTYVQRDQPPGVAPLELTGERTLPDVPEENYWFRRHLAVYAWIAERVSGLDVVDMACGEGYGADVLGGRARSVIGVDANPEAHAHAAARYRGDNLRFVRDLVERFAPEDRCDVVCFLQTIEHLEDPDAVLDHLRSILRPGGAAYISTPNVLTLAPKGADRSGNPWHVREYRAEEFAGLVHAHFSDVALHGLFHAHKLRWHDWMLRAGWDAVHPRVGLTGAFYSRFTPAISERDFALRVGVPPQLQRALDFVAVCRP
jgi:2-polyprenyl-3-methyl-5-hydroxy-6-metoxy-1,4-benzoquinol methylase